jgi:hypothetical protein
MAVTPVAAQSLGKQACLSPAAAIHLNLGHSSSQPTQLPKFAAHKGVAGAGSAALPASAGKLQRNNAGKMKRGLSAERISANLSARPGKLC